MCVSGKNSLFNATVARVIREKQTPLPLFGRKSNSFKRLRSAPSGQVDQRHIRKQRGM
jgi:hypothetical protein